MTLLSDIATEVLARCDMTYSQNVASPELLSYINSSGAELHEFLIANFGSDYALNEAFPVSASGIDVIPLPADFYKLVALDVQISSDSYAPVSRFNLTERHRYAPISQLPGNTFRLTYAPRWINATDLSASLPDYLAMQDWSEFIVCDVAIKIQNKLDVDASPFQTQKAALSQRILRSSAQRNASQPYELANSYHHDHSDERHMLLYPDRVARVRYRLAGNNIKLVPLTGWFWQ